MSMLLGKTLSVFSFRFSVFSFQFSVFSFRNRGRDHGCPKTENLKPKTIKD